MRSRCSGFFNASQSFLTMQRASVRECSESVRGKRVWRRTRAYTHTRERVYNDTAKAAPHVSHYDFSALLLIKMQIYRGGGASERERSGGKTDYVWGRHDKHRNMINSTQPHPGTPTPPPSPRPPAAVRPCPALSPPLTCRISFFPSRPTSPTFRHTPRDLSDQFPRTTRTGFPLHLPLAFLPRFPPPLLPDRDPFPPVQIRQIINVRPWKPCQAPCIDTRPWNFPSG